MEVELLSDLLNEPESPMLLLAGIFAFGAECRHRIVADDRVAFDTWIDSLGDHILRDELKAILDEGERQHLYETNSKEKVVVSESGKGTPIQEAYTLLGYPFRVLLENGQNDRDFLLSYATTEERDELLEAEQRGWLIFESGGGIGGVITRLEELIEATFAPARLYCLVDSDATDFVLENGIVKGTRSGESELVLELLGVLAVEPEESESVARVGHILNRRAVENYTDLRSLKRWLSGQLEESANHLIESWEREQISSDPTLPMTTRSLEEKLLATLALESANERFICCYDFSLGRMDGDKVRTKERIWNELTSLQQDSLEAGLGKKFLRSFYQAHPASLQDPTHDQEIKEILQTILERY